jgi:hypothetical protein
VGGCPVVEKWLVVGRFRSHSVWIWARDTSCIMELLFELLGHSGQLPDLVVIDFDTGDGRQHVLLSEHLGRAIVSIVTDT